MKALILAAGFATRMYPLTENFPKPLLDINGKPVINYIIEKIAPIQDIDEIFIVTNNKFYNKFLEWSNKLKINKKINIINDNSNSELDKKGALGDIQFTIKKENIQDDILIIGGDNLFTFDLQDICNYYKEINKSIIALFDVGSLELIKNYSVVELDGEGRVTSFEEKPPIPKTTLASVCIYLYKNNILKRLEEYLSLGYNKDSPGYFLEWLYEVEPIYGYTFEKESWYDIGSIEIFEKARKEFK